LDKPMVHVDNQLRTPIMRIYLREH
jgi:hypothetical protein